jgi:hypothetical protein
MPIVQGISTLLFWKLLAMKKLLKTMYTPKHLQAFFHLSLNETHLS